MSQTKPSNKSTPTLVRTTFILSTVPIFIVGFLLMFFIGIPSLGISPVAPANKIVSDITNYEHAIATQVPRSNNPHNKAPATSYASLPPTVLYQTIISQRSEIRGFQPGKWQTDGNACQLIADSTHPQINNYAVKTSVPNHPQICMNTQNYYKNFAYQAMIHVVPGDTAGLIFGADEQHDYRFFIDLTGVHKTRYQILSCLRLQCANARLQDGEVLATGILKIESSITQIITLTVIAQQSRVDLFINNQLLTDLHNTELITQLPLSPNGHVGAYITSMNSSAVVLFSDLKIWNLN